MRFSDTFGPLFVLLAAFAAPAPDPQLLGGLVNGVVCLLNGVLTALLSDPLAAPYCLSLLGIPTATVGVALTLQPTVTSTVTTNGGTQTNSVTQTVAGAEATSTVTITGLATSTVTAAATTTTVTCLTAAISAAPARKRDYARDDEHEARAAVVTPRVEERQVSVGLNLNVPSALSGLGLSAQSLSCSCLSIPTPTVTGITATVFAGIPLTRVSTLNIGALATVLSTLLVTNRNTVTSTVTTITGTTTVTRAGSATGISGQAVDGGSAQAVADSGSLNFRKFSHTYDASSPTVQFAPSYFKNRPVDFTGTAQSLSFQSAYWPAFEYTYINVGTATNFDSSKAGVLFQGFYVARQTGIHTFTTSANTDNWGYLWTGTAAYTWADGTTTIASSRVGPNGVATAGRASFTMTTGDALPITYLWVNGGGAALSDLRVTLPDGSSVDMSGRVVGACSSGNPFS